MDFEETNEYIFININNNKILAIKPFVNFLQICEKLNNSEINEINLDFKNKIINSYKIVLLDDVIHSDRINKRDGIMYNYIESNDLLINKNFNVYYNNYYNICKWLKYEGPKLNNDIIMINQNIPNIPIDLSNLYCREFIMNKNINNDIIVPIYIKLIKLSRKYNNNIININDTQCECLIMGELFNKKICLPNTIIYLEIGLNFNKEIYLPNKLKYLILHNNNNNIIDYLPNSVEYLKIYYHYNSLNHSNCNKYNLNDLPNSIKILTVDENLILNNDIVYLPPCIKYLEIFTDSKFVKAQNEYYYTDDNFLNLIKFVNYNVVFLHKYEILFSFIDNFLSVYSLYIIITIVRIIVLNLTQNIIPINFINQNIIIILIKLLEISILCNFSITKNLFVTIIIPMIICLHYDKINKYNLYFANIFNNNENNDDDLLLYIKKKILLKIKINILNAYIKIKKIIKLIK